MNISETTKDMGFCPNAIFPVCTEWIEKAAEVFINKLNDKYVLWMSE